MNVVKKIDLLCVKSFYSLVRFSQIPMGQECSTVWTADVVVVMRERKKMGAAGTEEGKIEILFFNSISEIF